MAKYELLAGLASSFGLFAFMSIVFRVYHTHDTSAITLTSLLSNLMAQIMLLVYSNANQLMGLFYPIIVYIVGISYVLYVKLFHNKEIEML